MRINLCALTLALGLIASQAPTFAAETEPTPGVLLETDVEYGTGGGVPLHIDIARPKEAPSAAQGYPAVLFVHGGGWRGGDKSGYRGALLAYAKLGYVAAAVQYRFAPAHKWPAQIEDVKCAVRYLRSRAKDLKIDPEHIGATGGSAGGHLVLLLATTQDRKDLEGTGGHAQFSSKVSAVVSLAGPTDFAQTFPDVVEAMIKDLIGTSRESDLNAFKKASPIYDLNKGDAPILAIHGTNDVLVPHAQAVSLVEAAKKAGVEASLITIPDGGHGSGGKPEDWHNANLKSIEFFNQHLKPK